MSYQNVTFNELSPKRQTVVREKIAELWADGFTAEEISKRVKVGTRSVATAMGNLTRKHVASKAKTSRRTSR
jgi:DNA-binding CsgD family transcriptional regulator